MGISIYARGRLDRLEDLPQLIDEVKGIAESRGWRWAIIDDDFEAEPDAVLARGDAGEAAAIEGTLGVKGVVLTFGAKTEALSILFDRSGVLTDVANQIFRSEGDGAYEPFTACKTQFGSIDTHIHIIELLDRMKKRYLPNLEVIDEGAYWESRDPGMLAEKRAVLEHYLCQAEEAISSLDRGDLDSQDAEGLASRIEEALLESAGDDKLLH